MVTTLSLLLAHKQLLVDRLEEKTTRTAGCWYWTGSRQQKGGYGWFMTRVLQHIYVTLSAHVLAWILANEQVPPKHLHVLHTCDTRHCVNPDHLRLGTHQENMADKMAKGRHPKGAEFEHAKLTDQKVRTILRERARGTTQKALASRYGVTVQAISSIDRGLTWKHVKRLG